mgnify:CR=1 FL=1
MSGEQGAGRFHVVLVKRNLSVVKRFKKIPMRGGDRFPPSPEGFHLRQGFRLRFSPFALRASEDRPSYAGQDDGQDAGHVGGLGKDACFQNKSECVPVLANRRVSSSAV